MLGLNIRLSSFSLETYFIMTKIKMYLYFRIHCLFENIQLNCKIFLLYYKHKVFKWLSENSLRFYNLPMEDLWIRDNYVYIYNLWNKIIFLYQY